MREDQMAGCHHRLNGSELEQALAKKKRNKLWEFMMDRKTWHTAVHRVTKSWI